MPPSIYGPAPVRVRATALVPIVDVPVTACSPTVSVLTSVTGLAFRLMVECTVTTVLVAWLVTVPLVMEKLAIRGPEARHWPMRLRATGLLLKLKYSREYTVVTLLACLLSIVMSRRVVNGLMWWRLFLNTRSMKPSPVLGPPRLVIALPYVFVPMSRLSSCPFPIFFLRW